MEPINYLALMPQIDLGKNIASGLQIGNAIKEMQQADAARQAAIARQAAYQQAVNTAMQSPSPRAFMQLGLSFPEHREAIKDTYGIQSAEDKKTALSDATELASLLQSNRPDLAEAKIQQRIEAATNSGQDPSTYQNLLGVLKQNPSQVLGHSLSLLAGVDGGDKVITSLLARNKEEREQGLFGSSLVKSEAEASSAVSKAAVDSVAATNAPTATALGNAKTQQDIQKSKDDSELALLNAQIASANSETQRGELTLKRDQFIQERDAKKLEIGQKEQAALEQADNLFATAKEIKELPAMASYRKAGNVAWDNFTKALPATQKYALDASVETLKSQLTLDKLMQLKASGGNPLGVTSDKDLATITKNVANLDTANMEFPKQLEKVLSFVERSRNKAIASPNLPTSGGAFVAKLPNGMILREGDINAALKRFPGMTREQALAALGGAK